MMRLSCHPLHDTSAILQDLVITTLWGHYLALFIRKMANAEHMDIVIILVPFVYANECIEHILLQRHSAYLY